MPPAVTTHSDATVIKTTRCGTGTDRQNLNYVQGLWSITLFFGWLFMPYFLLGCPKCSFRSFHKMLWENPNELFGQPNIYTKTF